MVAGGELDGVLAVFVLGAAGVGPVGVDVGAQRVGLLDEPLELAAGEGQHGAGRGGLDRVVPGAGGQQGVVADVVAVGQQAEGDLVAVGAGADLGELAVGDQDHVVGGPAGLHDDVAGGELALGEAFGQGGQGVGVVEDRGARGVR